MALSIEAIIGAVAVFVSLPPSLVILWNLIKQKNHKESLRRGITPHPIESRSAPFVRLVDIKLAETRDPQKTLPASSTLRSHVTFAISVSDSSLEEGMMHINRRQCKSHTFASIHPSTSAVECLNKKQDSLLCTPDCELPATPGGLDQSIR